MPPFTLEFDITERTTQRIVVEAESLSDAIEGLKNYELDLTQSEFIMDLEHSINNIRVVPPVHICMSGFDVDECYTDKPESIRGWTVYARFDPEADAPFELNDQQDFGSKEAASQYAGELMKKYGTEDFRMF